MILIREARLSDIPEMRQVAISTYRDTFSESNTPENMRSFIEESYNLPSLTNEFHEKNSMLFLACEENKIIGFSRLRESEEVRTTLGENTLELHRLYVLTEAQGKSVGKLLMEASLLYAKERGYNWIWLGVWERNVHAQRFYRKWGFEKFSEHIFWMGEDAQTDWLLKKKL